MSRNGWRWNRALSITVYASRIKDQRTGRWRKLRWKMTEDHTREWSAKEGVAIEKLEAGAEVRQPINMLPLRDQSGEPGSPIDSTRSRTLRAVFAIATSTSFPSTIVLAVPRATASSKAFITRVAHH